MSDRDKEVFVLRDAPERVQQARRILADAKGDPEKGEAVIEALRGLGDAPNTSDNTSRSADNAGGGLEQRGGAKP